VKKASFLTDLQKRMDPYILLGRFLGKLNRAEVTVEARNLPSHEVTLAVRQRLAIAFSATPEDMQRVLVELAERDLSFYPTAVGNAKGANELQEFLGNGGLLKMIQEQPVTTITA